LRSHERAGGRMVSLCRKSMVIEKPVGFWEAWSGQLYDQVKLLNATESATRSYN
jgi:hypothetical protein